MAETIVKLTDNLEQTFDGLGLGSGPLAPVARAGVGFVLGTAIYGFFRPSVSYMPNGEYRPWAITSPNAPNPTLFPWWGPGAITAVLFGAFV